MAPVKGLEPLTSTFGRLHSIQLSYTGLIIWYGDIKMVAPPGLEPGTYRL